MRHHHIKLLIQTRAILDTLTMQNESLHGSRVVYNSKEHLGVWNPVDLYESFFWQSFLFIQTQ